MSQSTYEAVTFRITEALEKGVIPWRQPWSENTSPPCNAVSSRPYSGINLLLLSISRFSDHRWVTFKQARELGGYVRPGEVSSLAIFWKKWTPAEKDGEEDPSRRPIPLLKHYHLFNVDQCEELKVAPLAAPSLNPISPLMQAELLIQRMPDPPQITVQTNSAWYRPRDDQVGMPPLQRFRSSESYYATFLHELAHATGHERRLARKGIMERTVFGSDSYGHEELVAELASAYCCAALGLDNSVVDDAASYIGHWLSVLKHDNKAIVIAASQAKRAADYLQGISQDAPEAA